MLALGYFYELSTVGEFAMGSDKRGLSSNMRQILKAKSHERQGWSRRARSLRSDTNYTIALDCAVVKAETMQGELRQTHQGLWERRAMAEHSLRRGAAMNLYLRRGRVCDPSCFSWLQHSLWAPWRFGCLPPRALLFRRGSHRHQIFKN